MRDALDVGSDVYVDVAVVDVVVLADVVLPIMRWEAHHVAVKVFVGRRGTDLTYACPASSLGL